ncbi:conserved hypothetical protein [Neospora caninum Liverpool]|uniref:RING-type domain-containing protein n=1 Tax=Neospora caninum (strain Liverpool) TaxID=572307 RepID=F0VD06_NEOCL|nr:conserved hypothetical protein [Neospora caninum Liverpool]CBZ51521.1 conserved hypothetical protein [Neospora caninum Liverpool]CEL65470.1 TPA: hypothetical protein BN1204_013140 [Neospora caninum Liverpool]|eukprot:XP_003881554.1 conserved hypothetical protein [Neospora caninum Liverpool]
MVKLSSRRQRLGLPGEAGVADESLRAPAYSGSSGSPPPCGHLPLPRFTTRAFHKTRPAGRGCRNLPATSTSAPVSPCASRPLSRLSSRVDPAHATDSRSPSSQGSGVLTRVLSLLRSPSRLGCWAHSRNPASLSLPLLPSPGYGSDLAETESALPPIHHENRSTEREERQDTGGHLPRRPRKTRSSSASPSSSPSCSFSPCDPLAPSPRGRALWHGGLRRPSETPQRLRSLQRPNGDEALETTVSGWSWASSVCPESPASFGTRSPRESVAAAVPTDARALEAHPASRSPGRQGRTPREDESEGKDPTEEKEGADGAQTPIRVEELSLFSEGSAFSLVAGPSFRDSEESTGHVEGVDQGRERHGREQETGEAAEDENEDLQRVLCEVGSISVLSTPCRSSVVSLVEISAASASVVLEDEGSEEAETRHALSQRDSRSAEADGQFGRGSEADEAGDARRPSSTATDLRLDFFAVPSSSLLTSPETVRQDCPDMPRLRSAGATCGPEDFEAAVLSSFDDSGDVPGEGAVVPLRPSPSGSRATSRSREPRTEGSGASLSASPSFPPSFPAADLFGPSSRHGAGLDSLPPQLAVTSHLHAPPSERSGPGQRVSASSSALGLESSLSAPPEGRSEIDSFPVRRAGRRAVVVHDGVSSRNGRRRSLEVSRLFSAIGDLVAEAREEAGRAAAERAERAERAEGVERPEGDDNLDAASDTEGLSLHLDWEAVLGPLDPAELHRAATAAAAQAAGEEGTVSLLRASQTCDSGADPLLSVSRSVAILWEANKARRRRECMQRGFLKTVDEVPFTCPVCLECFASSGGSAGTSADARERAKGNCVVGGREQPSQEGEKTGKLEREKKSAVELERERRGEEAAESEHGAMELDGRVANRHRSPAVEAAARREEGDAQRDEEARQPARGLANRQGSTAELEIQDGTSCTVPVRATPSAGGSETRHSSGDGECLADLSARSSGEANDRNDPEDAHVPADAGSLPRSENTSGREDFGEEEVSVPAERTAVRLLRPDGRTPSPLRGSGGYTPHRPGARRRAVQSVGAKSKEDAEGRESAETKLLEIISMAGRCHHEVCSCCAGEWVKHQLLSSVAPATCPVCRAGHFDVSAVRFLAATLGEWLQYEGLLQAGRSLPPVLSASSPQSASEALPEHETRDPETAREELEQDEEAATDSRRQSVNDLLSLLLPPEHAERQHEHQQALLEDDVFVHGFRRCPGCGIAIQRVGSLDDVVCRCGCRFCFACGESLPSQSFWALLQHRRSCRTASFSFGSPSLTRSSQNRSSRVSSSSSSPTYSYSATSSEAASAFPSFGVTVRGRPGGGDAAARSGAETSPGGIGAVGASLAFLLRGREGVNGGSLFGRLL